MLICSFTVFVVFCLFLASTYRVASYHLHKSLFNRYLSTNRLNSLKDVLNDENDEIFEFSGPITSYENIEDGILRSIFHINIC